MGNLYRLVTFSALLLAFVFARDVGKGSRVNDAEVGIKGDRYWIVDQMDISDKNKGL